MTVIIPGYRYVLENFDDKSKGQTIQFIQKRKEIENDLTPGGQSTVRETGKYVTVQDGTTNEELAKVLIDRINHLQSLNPCRENALAITKFEEGLMWLNARTQDRKNRGVEGTPAK